MDLYLEYLRKSRTDRDLNGSVEETLARHEKILSALQKERGYHVVKVYKEVVSGDSIASRPKMQKLLADVETGNYAGVLVVDIDRLARGNTIDQGIVAQTFQYTETKIITPSKVYDPNDEFDQEYFEYSLFMGRKEYKMIKKRLNSGRIASAKEGKYCGNIPPYGYRRYKLEREKGYSLTPETDEADIVRKIFHMYTGNTNERVGISAIANELNRLHVPTRKGAEWTSSSISSILKNPVYAGYIRWNWRRNEKSFKDGDIVTSRPRHDDYILSEGLHEPLISHEIFEETRQLFQDNFRSVPFNRNHEFKNPLAGLIVCSCCGRRMMRRPNANPKVRDTLICVYKQCTTVASYLDLVESEVLKYLDQYANSVSLNSSVRADDFFQIDYKKDSLKKLDEKSEKLTNQKKRLYDFLEQGIYSVDIFNQRMEKLEDELSDVQNQISVLQTEIDRFDEQASRIHSFLPRARYLLDNYALMSVMEKNTFLKELIDHIEYTKAEKNKFRNGNEISFELKIFPKI